MDDVATIANHFEDFISNGRMKFKSVETDKLSPFVQLVVEGFLTEHKLEWELGNIMIGHAVCFKVNDPYLHFLDVYPIQQKYQWAGEDHKVGIMPDDAMVYMIERALPGTKIEIKADGSVLLNDNLRIKTKQ